jgi:putative transposase
MAPTAHVPCELASGWYVDHYYQERNHQGKGNVLLVPAANQSPTRDGPIRCRERLGGLLKYYYREAA